MLPADSRLSKTSWLLVLGATAARDEAFRLASYGSLKERDVTLKGRFPFRLGTTSYIIPADILPNVEYLAPRVDDVELILFESDELSNIPDQAVVQSLKHLADEHDLTYTVHLPLDTALGDADEQVRAASVGKCARVADRMGGVGPFAYVLHLEGERRGDPPADDVPRWQSSLRRSVGELVGQVPADMLCVEYIGYPFALVEDIVSDYGLSVCLDVGHALLRGVPPESLFERYLDRTRVLHVHGLSDGKDHCDLGRIEPPVLSHIVSRLDADRETERVVTMEIFSRDDFDRSMAVMERYAT